MTDEQINIAIAEACGWTVELSYMQSGIDVIRDGKRRPLPDCCNDLNAMHEAEKLLIKNHNLWTNYFYCIGATIVLHATARQRAEAFLRTIGKWEEEAK